MPPFAMAALVVLVASTISQQALAVTCGSCSFAVSAEGVLRRTGTCSADCGSVSALYLSGFRIRDVPAGTFEGLASLQYLDLSYNQLSSLPAGIFSTLTGLQYLLLSDNQLSSLPVEIFANLTSLQHLDLSFNQLPSLPAGIFNGLSSLISLGIDDDALASVFQDQIAVLMQLNSLNLHNSSVQHPANKAQVIGKLHELDHLSSLSLTGYDGTHFSAETFSRLVSLRVLNMHELSALPEGVFANLSGLQELGLYGNQLPTLL
eukprot:317738-Hanusia_phi.AAC.1